MDTSPTPTAAQAIPRPPIVFSHVQFTRAGSQERILTTVSSTGSTYCRVEAPVQRP